MVAELPNECSTHKGAHIFERSARANWVKRAAGGREGRTSPILDSRFSNSAGAIKAAASNPPPTVETLVLCSLASFPTFYTVVTLGFGHIGPGSGAPEGAPKKQAWHTLPDPITDLTPVKGGQKDLPKFASHTRFLWPAKD